MRKGQSAKVTETGEEIHRESGIFWPEKGRM
jgi:hypothetical protein